MDAIPKNQITPENRERLEKDRQNYDKLLAEQNSALDKAIITISGASFSFSIGFIDRIIKISDSIILYTLWVALASLCASIIFTVISFRLSEKVLMERRSAIDDYEKTGDTNTLKATPQNQNRLILVNKIRFVFFILGMALLGLFICVNGIRQTYFLQTSFPKGGVSMDKTIERNFYQDEYEKKGVVPPPPRPQIEPRPENKQPEPAQQTQNKTNQQNGK